MSGEALAAGGSGDAGAVEQVADLARPLLGFFHSKLDGRSRRVEGFIAQVLQRRKTTGPSSFAMSMSRSGPTSPSASAISEVPTLLVVVIVVSRAASNPEGARTSRRF